MGRRSTTLAALAGLLLLLLCLGTVEATGATGEDEALALQQRAVARIDAAVAHFRKTGKFHPTRLGLKRARDELAASSKAFEARGDWAGAALSQLKLGDLERMSNRWSEAIAFYQQGFALAQRTGHRTYQAKARIGEARAQHTGFNKLGAAGRALAEAIELSKDSTDKRVRFDALDFLAALQTDRGELATAFETMSRALAAANEAGDEVNLYYAYLDRADIYYARAAQCDYGREFEVCFRAVDLATADYARAVELARRLGFDFLAQMAERFIHDMVVRRSLIGAKKDQHELMLRLPIFNPKAASNVLVHQYFLAEDGRRAIEEQVGTQQHDRMSKDASALLMPDAGAQLATLMEYAAEADRNHRDMCNSLAAGMASCDSPRTTYTRGLIHDLQGRRDEALKAYLRAVELLEEDRGNLADARGRGLFLEDKVGIYYQPVLHFLSRRQHREAFDLLERSRSRALADLVASRSLAMRNARDRNFHARLVQLSAEISRVQGDLFNLASGVATAADRDMLAEMHRHLQNLEGQYDALTTEITASAPRLRDLVNAEPVSLHRLQELAARRGFDVLQYLVLEDAVVAWWVGPHGSEARSIFLPRSVVFAKVAMLRESIEKRADWPDASFDEETARHLFLFLVQPLLQHIKSDRLVIIPQDVLHRLPFQALLDPVDGKYLGEKFKISYVPSATILASLEEGGPLNGARLVAAVDHAIAGAQREVETIAGLYPSHAEVLASYALPTEAMVRQINGADIVHFSVHGRFEIAEPLLSSLELRPEGEDDGQLTAAEMFGLQLEGVRLAVLSACESGEVSVTNANETLGMVRALLYAGANALVLSQWRVDTEATALWMEAFYRAARTAPLADAAQQAIETVKARPEYRHPYYWAAFQLVGG